MVNLKDVVNAVLGIKSTTIVDCPLQPMTIPGVVASDAISTASDAFGSIATLRVPKRGVIVSATYFDLDDEGTQMDLEIFKQATTTLAWDAAWVLNVNEALSFITEISFVSFDNHIDCQTSEVTNIGKAYTAPEGKFYIQAVTRGTPTIVAGAEPRFQLQIQSFDPDFKES